MGARLSLLYKHPDFRARQMQCRGVKGNAMERVIAGRFQTKHNAQAVAALIARYIDTTGIRISHNNRPGPLAGVMAELGVRNYKPRGQEPSSDRVMLSVRITNPVSENRVIAALRAAGAVDIEPDHDERGDGQWSNFNSIATPRPAESPSH